MAITVERSTGTREVHAFIVATPTGNPGGLRVRDADPQLERIPDAVWFVARDRGSLVGAYAMLRREWGWWRCHMTVAAEHRETVIPKLIEASSSYLSEHPMPAVAGSCEGSQVILRGALENAGYRESARTEVIVWSRRRPDAAVRPAIPEDYEAILEQLARRNVAWSDTLAPSAFLVLREGDAIRAGTVWRPLSWHIDALGPGSTLTLPVLRALGIRLNPLEFGAFLGSFGDPEALARVWSSALAHFNRPVALVGADVTDPRWKAWCALSRGRLGGWLGSSRQHILARGAVPRPLDWTEGFTR